MNCAWDSTGNISPTTAGNFKFPGLDQFPDLVFNDLNLELGPDSNAPQATIQNTYQLVDNVTWVKGAHTFQFGYDGRRSVGPNTFTQRSRGDYEYNSLDIFLRDLTPDSLAQRSVGAGVYWDNQWTTYLYAQDAWKIRPNFTVNLGLRYEYLSTPAGEKNQARNAISSVPGFLVFNVPEPTEEELCAPYRNRLFTGVQRNHLDSRRLRHGV